MTNSIRLDRKSFSAAVAIASKAVEKRSTIPILNCAHISSAEGLVTVTGTDLDLIVSATVPAAEPYSTMATLINADRLQKVLRGAPAAFEFDFATDAHNGNVLQFGKAKYAIPTLEIGDWPSEFRIGEEMTTFEMVGKELRDYLNRVSPAISDEETRYYLNGVFMHEYDGKGCFTATDGHRCHVQEFTAPAGMLPMLGGDEYRRGVIIPKKAVAVLLDLLKGKECADTVTVHAGVGKVSFHFTTDSGVSVDVISKTINGTFPDYRRIMPQTSSYVSMDTEEMREAIKAVAIVLENRQNGITFEMGNASPTISAKGFDGDRASFPLAIEYSGDAMIWGFNRNYLGDILDSFPKGEFLMGFSGVESPFAFTSSRQEGFTAVMMPLRYGKY